MSMHGLCVVRFETLVWAEVVRSYSRHDRPIRSTFDYVRTSTLSTLVHTHTTSCLVIASGFAVGNAVRALSAYGLIYTGLTEIPSSLVQEVELSPL